LEKQKGRIITFPNRSKKPAYLICMTATKMTPDEHINHRWFSSKHRRNTPEMSLQLHMYTTIHKNSEMIACKKKKKKS
jgi:hypothetical protein